MEEKPYQIENRGGIVALITTSFKTERGSVLHSGVFNRELASSLSAGGMIVIVSFFFALCFKISIPYWIAVGFLFAILFVFFRMVVFQEAVLETVFDREKGTITLATKRTIGSKVASYLLAELVGIRIGHMRVKNENIDAVRLVERIVLQHGTMIQGLGETNDFYTVELDFGEEKAVVFSAREKQGAEAMIARLRGVAGWLFPDMEEKV